MDRSVQMVWYILFIMFVTYAMLPLPLRTCMILGCTTTVFHIVYTCVQQVANPYVSTSNNNPFPYPYEVLNK